MDRPAPGLRLEAITPPRQDIMRIWRTLRLVDQAFIRGIIGDMVMFTETPVDWICLRTATEFWDPEHAVFNFQETELAPTIEEYTALIQRPTPTTQGIFVPNPFATIRGQLSSLLGIPTQDIHEELTKDGITASGSRCLGIVGVPLLSHLGSTLIFPGLVIRQLSGLQDIPAEADRLPFRIQWVNSTSTAPARFQQIREIRHQRDASTIQRLYFPEHPTDEERAFSSTSAMAEEDRVDISEEVNPPTPAHSQPSPTHAPPPPTPTGMLPAYSGAPPTHFQPPTSLGAPLARTSQTSSASDDQARIAALEGTVNQMATNMAELLALLRGPNRASSSSTPPPGQEPTTDQTPWVQPTQAPENMEVPAPPTLHTSMAHHFTSPYPPPPAPTAVPLPPATFLSSVQVLPAPPPISIPDPATAYTAPPLMVFPAPSAPAPTHLQPHVGLSYQAPPPINTTFHEPGTPTHTAQFASPTHFFPEADAEQERRLKRMEETIRALQAGNARLDARYGDCSLFPGMRLPPKFKFMSLKAEDIPTWENLSRKFIDQYRYCAETPPTLLELSTKEMAQGQRFEEYATKWRAQVAKHIPPISETKQIQLFHSTLRGVYYSHLLAHTSSFSDLIEAGKKLDLGIKLGRMEGPTSVPTILGEPHNHTDHRSYLLPSAPTTPASADLLLGPAGPAAGNLTIIRPLRTHDGSALST
ncbi:hypothetical protein CRG98_000665 [Punica granatum]|uniref:DUF7745 domain-containing protein n=1 Tax=Punica granatum TaxID=22663 RepID=A0A2I0LE44_PUNGR|nr:hypothetical protein CRG98_000665 [Punica granatum]